jgi:hypothetical protein
MSEPSTAVTVFPSTTHGFYSTCPYHHTPPVVFRDPSAEVAGKACALHVEVEHGAEVIAIRDARSGRNLAEVSARG